MSTNALSSIKIIGDTFPTLPGVYRLSTGSIIPGYKINGKQITDPVGILVIIGDKNADRIWAFYDRRYDGKKIYYRLTNAAPSDDSIWNVIAGV